MLHAAALIIASSFALPTSNSRCAAVLRIIPGKVCAASAHGVVLAPERTEAERLAALARAGEFRFVRHFGRPPLPYAIVQGAAPGDLKALNGAGFRRTLPWLTPKQFEDGALTSVRRGAEAQAKARGVPAEALNAIGDRAVATWRERSTPAVRLAQEEGVVPHEAGHGWYVELFWSGVPVDAKGHYGGPGPDWLDETAAVLLESEKFAANRRTQFEAVYRGTATAPALAGLSPAELVDLPRFLSRDHPGKNLQQGIAAKPAKGGPTIRVLSGEEALSAVRGGALFYLQARVFADFLIERSGKPAIFASIGAAFGRGETIEQWLAKEGRAHCVGTTLAALDREWRAWLATRYGPVKSGATA